MGGIAGGFVGVGASIGIVTVTSNVTASAGGTLTAGGDITVASKLNEDIGVLSIAGPAASSAWAPRSPSSTTAAPATR
jgi:hypothetical protein